MEPTPDELLGAVMESEYQATMIAWAKAWVELKEAEAKAAQRAKRSGLSGRGRRR